MAALTRRVWLLYLGLGLVGIAVYLGIEMGPLAGNLVYDVVGLSAVVAIAVGVRLHRPPAAGAWWLIAAGQLLFVAGDVAWVVFELGFHIEPFPSVGDVLYLLGYPLLVAGVLRLIRARRGRDRGALIDASIIATGVGLVAWVLLIDSYVDDRTLGPLELAVSVAYPLADIMIVALTVRMAVAGLVRAPAYGLLMASLVLLLAADVVYFFELAGPGYNGGLVDGGWLLSYVVVGVAGLHPSIGRLSQPMETGRGSRRPPLGVLAGAALLAPVALLLQARRGVDWDDVVVLAVGSATVFLLVVGRLAGLVREVRTKAETLDRQGAELRSTLGDLQRTEAERRALLERTLRAAEEERVRIAADLHDGPIQRLSVLGFGVEITRRRLDRSDIPGATAGLDELEEGLALEVGDLRRLMASLRPPALDQQGLEGALRDHAASFAERAGVRTDVRAELRQRPAEQVETVLYRVAQEALQNVAKHARASRVSLDVRQRDGSVELAVRDDGVGFDPRISTTLREHFGLAAMREQVQMAGGDWTLISEPGKGTEIRAVLPMDPA